MTNDGSRPRVDDLGEGPERRQENFPEPVRLSPTDEGDRLIQQPGPAKPAEQDAVGEGAVEDLAQETDGVLLEEQERRITAESARAVSKEPPLDLRRRRREERGESAGPEPGPADLDAGEAGSGPGS